MDRSLEEKKKRLAVQKRAQEILAAIVAELEERGHTVDTYNDGIREIDGEWVRATVLKEYNRNSYSLFNGKIRVIVERRYRIPAKQFPDRKAGHDIKAIVDEIESVLAAEIRRNTQERERRDAEDKAEAERAELCKEFGGLGGLGGLLELSKDGMALEIRTGKIDKITARTILAAFRSHLPDIFKAYLTDDLNF